MGKRSLGYAVRRVQQSVTAFDGGLGLMATLVLASTPWKPEEITFRLRGGPTLVTPNVPGARFPVYEVFVDDVYDLDVLLAGLSGEIGVVDCGGQVGSFTLAVASKRPGARVNTYEASPSTATYLQRNVDRNGLQDRVTVHAAAVAGEAGTFELLDTGTASAHNGLTSPEAGAVTVQVPAIPLEEALLAAAPVHVVKLDIEGAEYSAILNCAPSAWDGVQRVVMEYHPMPERSVEDLQRYFGDLGFTTTRLDPGTRPGLGSIWLSR